MKSLRRHILLILIVAAIVAGLAGGGILPLNVSVLAPGDFSTTTREYDAGWTIRGGGQLVGNELLDSIAYVSGAASEKIFMEGRVIKGFAASCIVDHRYELSFTSGSVWGPVDETRGSGFVSVNPISWTPAGAQSLEFWTYPSGFLKVEFWILIHDFCVAGSGIEAGWRVAARDDSFIKWGDATIRFSQGSYEVGETVDIFYEVGMARTVKTDAPSSARDWSANLFSNAAGINVRDWVIPSPDPGSLTGIASGTLTYQVQPSDFRSGGCNAGFDNWLEIRLHNNLVLTKVDQATTIDQRALAPPQPAISVDKSAYVVGDPVIIRVVAEPNPTTQQPICGIKLGFVLQGITLLPPTNLFGSDITYTYFGLPDDGTLVITAWSVDDTARPSEPSILSVGVSDPTSTEFVDFTLFIFLMIVLFIIGVVILLPLPYLNQIPLNIRGGMSVLLIGSAVGIFVYAFVLPFIVSALCPLIRLLGGVC